MLAFFSIPRAFVGEFDELQRTAISSWESAIEEAQIILMGSDEGVQEVCHEYGYQHVPAVPRNSFGTPLLNGAFHLAESLTQFDLLCEISADIVLGADVEKALQVIASIDRPFVIGQRYDLDPGRPDSAQLHDPAAADYFIYRRGTLDEIPPFAVGRTAYDNWLIWAAVEKWGLTVIDATKAITAIHINHGYPVFKNGKGDMLAGEERQQNHQLAKATGCDKWYGVNNAPYFLENGEIKERVLA